MAYRAAIAQSLPTLLAVAGTCAAPPIRGGEWIEVAQISAEGATNVGFGIPFSFSHDTVVVGIAADDELGESAGAVRLFGRDQGGRNQWGELAKLTASDGHPFDLFGASVSIHGDRLIVGAYDEKQDSPGNAYVFGRDQGGRNQWGELAKLTPSDGSPGDLFGNSVAIFGDTAVVGAVEKDLRGAAYIFHRDQGGPNQWGEVTRLVPSVSRQADTFGRSVAIWGDTVVVGEDRGDENAGTAYVFQRDQGGDNTWGQVARLITSDREPTDSVGGTVSIFEDTILLGARNKQSTVGAAYLFARNAESLHPWREVARLSNPEAMVGDHFGLGLSVHGDLAAVGANQANGNDEHPGKVYLFGRGGGEPNRWESLAELVPSDGRPDDSFGFRVATSGDTVVVGTWMRDQLYVFQPVPEPSSFLLWIAGGIVAVFAAVCHASTERPSHDRCA